MMWAALAAPPVSNLRPVAADINTPTRFAEWTAKSGRPGELPVCVNVWSETAVVCFRVYEGKRRRWVVSDDLLTWQASPTSLQQAIVPGCERMLSELEKRSVDKMDAHYYLLRDGDGWAASGVLLPEQLRAKIGASAIRVAMPVEGILIAWPGGNDELDRVMAVSVHEAFTKQVNPVSPVIFNWSDGRWSRFGEAKPVEAQK